MTKKIPNRTDRLASIFHDMMQRCTKPNNPRYKYYGGRGIKICEEWVQNRQSFYNWAVNNGYSKDLTIDRIDNDGNYCPENCKWSTNKEQSRNKTVSAYVTYKGETLTKGEWCERYGIDRRAFCIREKLGWSVEKILTTPMRNGNYYNPVRLNIEQAREIRSKYKIGIPQKALAIEYKTSRCAINHIIKNRNHKERY